MFAIQTHWGAQELHIDPPINGQVWETWWLFLDIYELLIWELGGYFWIYTSYSFGANIK